MERATKRNQKPRLRKAMFKMFAPQFIVEGFECFAFILIKQVFVFFFFSIVNHFCYGHFSILSVLDRCFRWY